MKLLAALLLPALSFAGVWPDNFGEFHRTSAEPVMLSDRALWDEYGFQQAERAQYEAQGRKFTSTAYRLQDSTGALGAFQWRRPANAKPSPLGKLAVEAADAVLLAHGNYLLLFEGYKPAAAEVASLLQTLPALRQAPLPALPAYLPATGIVPNSERYVTGPVALRAFDPGIPASTAAFQMGAEAQLGSFRAEGGEMKLAIFSYPTPQIARERLVDFQRISGAMAQRSGPMVSVILSPADAGAAQKLLAEVRYEPNITWNERVPTPRDNIGSLVITAFKLIGILLGFFTFAGLLVAGFRAFAVHSRPAGQTEGMITLNLSNR